MIFEAFYIWKKNADLTDASAGINMTPCLSFAGFESILEGLFGPGLVKDITLFQGKHAKPTNLHLQIQLYTNSAAIGSNAQQGCPAISLKTDMQSNICVMKLFEKEQET